MISFEEKQDVVDNEIRKRRSRWFLGSVTYLDFDDVSQILRAHIYKKWHLWDQSKQLEPWLNRVISNQIKNLIRNNYGVFAKPCTGCPFNESTCVEPEACSFTEEGKQNTSCPLFKKWSKSKKHEFNIKMPMSFEVHDFELKTSVEDHVDMEVAAEKLHMEMKKRLTAKQFLAYTLLYIKNLSDENVAKKLGYKTSEKNRTAGYRQIKNLKNMFQDLAKKIMKEEDIFYV